jgi:hypothetical protein
MVGQPPSAAQEGAPGGAHKSLKGAVGYTHKRLMGATLGWPGRHTRCRVCRFVTEKSPLFRQAWLRGAAFSKRMNSLRNTRSTFPVGPLRCLTTLRVAWPGFFSGS